MPSEIERYTHRIGRTGRAGKDGLAVPDNWLAFPSVKDGADGVRFTEATVISNDNGGRWEKI